ncbi:MAG TPA: CHAT domain-containing protein [Terriglobales bacterium]|jgi:CHAT domain-containing protein/Tfp pilus assembly protein PilF|nr:CHAT domain-containing protein [Terriglobales bacterium]
MARSQRLCLALLLATCVTVGECAWAQFNPGVVIEEVAKNSEGERAGLQPGDIVLRWSRAEAKGEIESPFDLSAIEIEQEPQGNVTLEGTRGEEKRVWVMGPDDWGMKTRPNLSQNLLSIYQEGQELAKAGKGTEAAERWRRAATEAQNESLSALSTWLLFHAAEQFADARQWKEADDAYRKTLEMSDGTEPALRAQLFRSWAVTYERRDEWKRSQSCYQQAIDSQKSNAESLLAAAILSSQGEAFRLDTELAKAEEDFRYALAIQQKIAPDSLPVAQTLMTLGLLNVNKGDMTAAEDYQKQALAIRERLAPGSRTLATSIYYLGVTAWWHGNFAEAGKYEYQALEMRKRLAPDSLDLASTFHNLGNLVGSQGEMTKAEAYYRKALAIREKLAPGGLAVSTTLTTLGEIARARGELAKAADYYSQALAIQQKFSPGGLNAAINLINLGDVARQRGEKAAAKRYLRQALAIQEERGLNNLDKTSTLDSLGDVFNDANDLAAAEKYYRRAFRIREKAYPDSFYVAWSLQHLGDLALKRHDWKAAEEQYHQALALQEKQAPVSLEHAETLAALAGIERRRKQFDDAARLYKEALDVFESQTAMLGGSEDIRSRFRAQHAGFYHDYMDLLISEKKPDQAFQILERWHARTLQEMLAAAHVDIHTGVDPGLIQQERRLRQTFNEKAGHRIQLLNGDHTAEQVTALDQEIKDVLKQQQDVEDQIRASSPAYAALTQPQPLSITDVQQMLLDADTTLLEYVLGQDRSYVFVVSTTSLAAYKLPKREEIERAARRLYQLLRTWHALEPGKNSMPSSGLREMEIRSASTALSRIVLAPVAGQLQRKRLLIVSDGALQYIPFAALPEPAHAGDAHGRRLPSPLIAEHEVIKLPSASVLETLRQQAAARNAPDKAIAVLADPVFDKEDERLGTKTTSSQSALDASSAFRDTRSLPASGAASAAVSPEDVSLSTESLTRSLADVGAKTGEFRLSRLPFTRREAEAIVAVTPEGQRMEALDFDASRATATDPKLGEYRIVHFATHGLLDSEHPELSGLVLSLVDKQGHAQNGFLGLEDIYNLNLPADLVVLSACETGLGKEINGEGLVGLTRGFMYAGASRVMASLWKVDDVATAELMRRFYQGVEQQGMRPAAALHKAQLEMWQQKRWRDPYYWAAFELQGEWK